MAIGKKTGGGSRKGKPNKSTVTVRENTLAVFDLIGGRPTMAKWARENLTEFFKLYGRMAPADPDAPGGKDNPVRFLISASDAKL
jgi:hypothetical protein